MKKNFITPNLKISRFSIENIVTTSGAVSQADKISALKTEALESGHMQGVTVDNILEFTL